ncbi:hypothetical protein [Paracoccus mutanolyticus]|uniref:hypothetical protein n=1 Tax=Paracoccus mutanolyticus TaxID=1499308 RepID=UPI001CB984E1|nr:hypothetical protein [Paracoccus mutanolyticus]
MPTLNEKASRLMGKAAIGLEYLLKRSGPMAMARQPVFGFLRTRRGLAMHQLPGPLP